MKSLVLDANVLIRAVLGKKVEGLIHRYVGMVDFACPEQAFEEAEEHLPKIIAKRGGNKASQEAILDALIALAPFIQIIPQATFEQFETQARARLKNRDEEDWAYLALALRLNCPIWTEDTDFFGTGVAIWTTDRVETYLQDSEQEH